EPLAADGPPGPVVAGEELAAAADARDLRVALARAPAGFGAGRAAIARGHAFAGAHRRARDRRRRAVRPAGSCSGYRRSRATPRPARTRPPVSGMASSA